MQRESIYARSYSGAQRPASIDQQIQVCRSYAAAHDIEVEEVYEDPALTGTSEKRPAFRRMIRDSAKSNREYIIFYTLDRFARNRYDSATCRHRLKENSVRLPSAPKNISDDITGGLPESVLEGFSEDYSRQPEDRAWFIKRKDRMVVILAILLGISVLLIITALVVDWFNPSVGFFWRETLSAFRP